MLSDSGIVFYIRHLVSGREDQRRRLFSDKSYPEYDQQVIALGPRKIKV